MGAREDVMAAEQSERGRRRSSRPRRAIRSKTAYRHLENPFTPTTVFSEDQVAHVHESALAYLQASGIRVLLPEARRLFREARAVVEDETRMVRLDADLVRWAVASAPSSFEIHARNQANTARIGGRGLSLLAVAGPPYVSDLERGRRPGTLADFEHFVMLTQRCDVLHAITPAVEAQDVPMNLRHLATGHSMLTISDKVPYVNARGRGVVADGFEMIRIANGLTDDQFRAAPYVWTNINTNSPRQLDIPMSMGIIDFAAAGQATIMTPFTLSGAMAPVSLAGALVLQHIEALAAITLSQVVRAGAPIVYGAFTSNVDMKSGAPAFGTPEGVKAAIASGQLARHIEVPWRSQAASTSNTEDAQGGYETMLSMMACLMGGANVVVHAAGWQEGGLTASLEKFVLDVEMLQIIAETFQPVVLDDAELAIDAIDDVGPGGHFFGTQHTLDRFETAFYEPTVFTRQNFGQWTDGGSSTAAQRAHHVWQQWIREFERPPIDDAVQAALDEFVARRTAAGGALPES